MLWIRFANIFMAEFEQKCIYPLIKDKSILFLHCIDDIFMVWTKSKNQLKDFMSELNQKYPSIKFDFKFDCKQIEFLNTLVYIDQQNKLQTTVFRKSSDCQNFLNAKSEHSYSLKKSIPYSQALQTQKVEQLDRKQLLHHQKHHNKQCIPLSVKYSQALPNLKDILTKHWHILQANQSSKKSFSMLPIIAFRKGTSVKQIIGTNTIHNNEKLRIIIIQESVSHATQHVAFAVNNLFEEQHSKVIKPTKR